MAYSKQTWDTTSYVNPTRMNHIEQGIEDVSKKFTKVETTSYSSSGGNTIWNFPTNEGFTYQNSIIIGCLIYRSDNQRYYANDTTKVIPWVALDSANSGGRLLTVDGNYASCRCEICLMRTDI